MLRHSRFLLRSLNLHQAIPLTLTTRTLRSPTAVPFDATIDEESVATSASEHLHVVSHLVKDLETDINDAQLSAKIADEYKTLSERQKISAELYEKYNRFTFKGAYKIKILNDEYSEYCWFELKKSVDELNEFINENISPTKPTSYLQIFGEHIIYSDVNYMRPFRKHHLMKKKYIKMIWEDIPMDNWTDLSYWKRLGKPTNIDYVQVRRSVELFTNDISGIQFVIDKIEGTEDARAFLAPGLPATAWYLTHSFF